MHALKVRLRRAELATSKAPQEESCTLLAGVPMSTRRACTCPLGQGGREAWRPVRNHLHARRAPYAARGVASRNAAGIKWTDLQRGQERARLRLRRRARKEVLHRGLGLFRGYRSLVANHGLHRRLHGSHAAERAPPGSLAPLGRRGTSVRTRPQVLRPQVPTDLVGLRDHVDNPI